MSHPASDAPEITAYLHRWREGDTGALDALVPHVYDALRAIAHRRLRGESAASTLDTGGLVHEAYLRLGEAGTLPWRNRAHFFAVAARTMRHILIDRARARRAAKRGGGAQAALDVAVAAELLAMPARDHDALLALDAALARLEAVYPRQASAIELRYFGDLTLGEVGEALGISAPTAMRDLRFAQAWLARELGVAGDA